MKAWLRQLAGSRPAAIALLTLLAAAFWILRVYGTKQVYPTSGLGGADLGIESYPLYRYAWEVVRSGALPLWNPYQLCGTPLMAIPYSGLFYPGNLLYLGGDVALGIELTGIAHLALAGGTLYWLIRALGMPAIAALAGAATWMICGGVVRLSVTPANLAGVCWLPMTLLLIEWSLRGRRLAPLGLSLCVAIQLLNGATEIIFYNLMTGAAWTLMRSIALARTGALSKAVGRSGVLLLAVVGGAGLAAFQLLPTLELVGQSARAQGVSLEQALFRGAYPLEQLVWHGLAGRGVANSGAFSIVALVLAFAVRRQRALLWLCLGLAMLTAALASGGDLYRLYFESPLGQLFRRPRKLLYLHQFALALVVAIGVTALVDWQGLSRTRLWRRVVWLGVLLLGVGVTGWVVSNGVLPAYLMGTLALLIAYGLSQRSGSRAVIVVLVALLQVASAISTSRGRAYRPLQDVAAYDTHARLLERARRIGAGQRIFGDRRLFGERGVTPKQGGLRRLHFVDDYNPLRSERHSAFLDAVNNGERWAGPRSRLELLDLAGASVYLTRQGSDLDQRMEADAEAGDRGVALVGRQVDVRLWKRSGAVPRAYYVGSAHIVDSTDVLARLAQPGFRPFEEVLLEREEGASTSAGVFAGGAARGEARILVDEAEHVEVEVRADAAGHLVLIDSYYPGWQAFVDGVATPIQRANYLFRAVPVQAGRSRVVFDYRPRSLRLGMLISVVVALALTSAFIALRRRRDTG